MTDNLIWDDTNQRWVTAPPRAAAPTVPPYAKPHVPGAGALMDAAPTRDDDDASDAMTYTMVALDVVRHHAGIENRARDAGPEILKTLKALFAVVGARHLTTDTLHTYIRAKDLIERIEGSGS